MKTLYVIRHAKSSWTNTELSDFERPLNDRGKRDAPRMGKRLKEKDIHPDFVISSPAKRAISTAKRICEELGFNKDHIKTDRRLYHAEDSVMLSVLQETKNKFDKVVMVGHNPGLTDFVTSLMNEGSFRDIHNVPTAGVAAFSFDVDDWKAIKWETGTLLFFDFPKSRED